MKTFRDINAGARQEMQANRKALTKSETVKVVYKARKTESANHLVGMFKEDLQHFKSI